MSDSQAIDVIMKLKKAILAITFGRLEDFELSQTGNHILVHGRSDTYYVKQLVTQEIQSVEPNLTIDNQITVNTKL